MTKAKADSGNDLGFLSPFSASEKNEIKEAISNNEEIKTDYPLWTPSITPNISANTV